MWGVLSWHIADVQLQNIQVHSVMLRDEKQEEKGLAMTGKWPLILKQPWLKGNCRSSFQGRPREDTWNTNNSTFRKMNSYSECVTWVEKGGSSPFIPTPLVRGTQDNNPRTASKNNDPIYNCIWASNFKEKVSIHLPKYISLCTFGAHVLTQQLVCNGHCWQFEFSNIPGVKVSPSVDTSLFSFMTCPCLNVTLCSRDY